MSSCSLAKSGSVPLLVKDGAIDRLVSEQVADADLVTWSLDNLLLGEGHVGPGVPAEYQLPTGPETKTMIFLTGQVGNSTPLYPLEVLG